MASTQAQERQQALFSEKGVSGCVTPKGTLVCTLTSNGYKFYTLNLVRQLQEVLGPGQPWRLAVFCADAGSHTFLQREGVPCIRLQGAPSTLDAGAMAPAPFGSRQFQLMNRRKLDMLAGLGAAAEGLGIKRIIYMDGDIAVYRDFVPDIEVRLATAPDTILMQCDEGARVDCSGTACPNRCTGFFAWNCEGVGGAAMRDVLRLGGKEAEEVWRAKPEDQPFVNQRLAAAGLPVVSLPRDLYPNGVYASVYGRRRLAATAAQAAGQTAAQAAGQAASPMLLHYNYMVGDAKKGKMRANGDWLLPY